MKRNKHLGSRAFIILGAAAFLALGFTLGRKAGEITPGSIDSAADLIGLSFNPQEKDSMINALNTQRNNFEILRKTSLENSVAPALVFNPLPQGFVPSQNQKVFDWGLPAKVDLPSNENDIAFMPVSELSVLIKNKQISAERLTKIYLDRIKTHSDTLQCLVSLLEESALIKAQAMDKELAEGKYRGPLHGIPYGIKDLLAVPDTKTTWGANPYKNQVINETATVVQKLEDAGGVLVGKFTLGALAMGDVWFGGVTKNPWNLKQGSSGSSAGSASAVSAGLVPFAIGTETIAPPTGLVDRCLLWRLPVGVTSPLRTAHGRTHAIHPTKERLDRFGIGLTGQLGDQEASQDVVGVGVDPALRFTEGRHHRAVCGHEGAPIFWHHLISGVGQVFGQAAGVPQQ
jgi:hypothetical protein